MDNLLSCGHPVECFNTDEDYCEWCADMELLRGENAHLRMLLGEQAIIVNGGELHLSSKKVGFLEIRGGTVYLSVGLAAAVLGKLWDDSV